LNDGVRIDIRVSSGQDIRDIGSSLFDVALNIHRETWGLRDGQTEIECDNTWNTAEADEKSPHIVDVVEVGRIVFEKRSLVGRHDNE